MYPKYSNQGSNLAINGTNPTALPRAGPLAAFYLQTAINVNIYNTW